MKNVITDEEILSESKGETIFRLAGDLFKNMQNNLNCNKSTEEFNKDVKNIGKYFNTIVKAPDIPVRENMQSRDEDDDKKYSSFTVPLSNNTSVIYNTFKRPLMPGETVEVPEPIFMPAHRN